MESRRIAVVGGGISGLVAARRLSTSHEVRLFESEARLGGKLQTVEFRGRPLDLGPDAFLRRNPAALDLAQSLGLGAELIAPAARGAALYARGALRPLPERLAVGIPTDPRTLWSSGVVSRRETLRAASDLVRPRSHHDLGGDPSVGAVLAPRLGRAVVETLVDPLIGGINASDVDSLSLDAALPQLAQLLGGRASVMRALRPVATNASAPGAPPLFAGLESGIELLAERLAADCENRGVAISAACPVRALLADGPSGGWHVVTGEHDELFAAVVVALPAYLSGDLLAKADAELAAGLSSIPYAGVLTATYAFSPAAVPPATSARLARLAGGGSSPSARALPGAGVLVPRRLGLLSTAMSFTSTKWPRSAAQDEVVVRVSAGRHGDERALCLDDDGLAAALRGELATVLGIADDPLASIVARFPSSFPQYVTGHRALVRELRRRAANLTGLGIVGAAYDGIGIPSCVAAAEAEAARLDETLSR